MGSPEETEVSGEGFTEKGRTYKQGAEVERSLLNGESRMESRKHDHERVTREHCSVWLELG